MKGHGVEVGVDRRGVWFSIDHQKFRLDVEADTEQPKRERHRWYAKQLRIALGRLAPAAAQGEEK